MTGAGRRAAGLLTALLLGIFAECAVIEGRLGPEDRTARRAVAETVGVAMLALTSECTAVRSLVEGLCGCLGDAAGGPCTHDACDLVAPPSIAPGARRLAVRPAP